jgi:hypothetical protein
MQTAAAYFTSCNHMPDHVEKASKFSSNLKQLVPERHWESG